MTFDNAPTLTNETLCLRPLQASDFYALADAASDPAIWAGHPAQDRYRPDVFKPYFDMLLDAGGALIIQDRASGDIIGCSRYYPAPEGSGEVGIGFTFLITRCWGGAVNRELKTLMVNHVLTTRDRVWFHIDPTNIRSQKATSKLGARYVASQEHALGPTPATWMCFALERSDWVALMHPGQLGQSP